MATKKVKQNLEQYRAVAVEGEPIAVAILEQQQRKLSVGYLQNSDLQFPNLTHAHPMPLFTLVFSYQKGVHHIKQRQGINIEKIKGKRGKRLEFKETGSASEKNPAELFGFNLYRSPFVLFFTLD